MSDWWYAAEGKQFGPIAEADLIILFQQGRINQHTLVWTHGQSQWQRLADLPQLATYIIKPPPLPVSIPPAPLPPIITPTETRETGEHPRPITSDRSSTKHRAGVAEPGVPEPKVEHAQIGIAWRRFLAKHVDVIVSIGILIIAQIALAFISPPFQVWLQNPNNAILSGVAMFALSPLTEALLTSTFGNSPGKALLGLRALGKDGQKLDFSECILRNFRVMWFGLGAFIPFITIFTMSLQYRNIKRDGTTAYDIGRYRIIDWPVSPARYLIAITFILTSFAASRMIEIEGRDDAKHFAQGQQWANPITLARVEVQSGWVASSQKTLQGQTVYIFTRPAEELQVIFGQESISANLTFGSYVQAFVRAVQKDMKLNLPGQPEGIGLHDAWTIRGNMTEDPASLISVTFLPRDERVWRVVGVRLRGADPETDAYLALRNRLLLSATSGK